VSEATELVEWLRQVLCETLSPPGRKLRQIEQDAEKIPAVIWSDSNNLEDTVSKDAGVVADRRFRIVISMLRQIFSQSALRLKWCNSQERLADGLTKVLPYQPDLTALMAAVGYSVPKGRLGRVASLAAAAASRLTTAKVQFAAEGHVVVVHAVFSWWAVLWTVVAVMVVWIFFQRSGCGKMGDSTLRTRDHAEGTIPLDSTTQTPTTLTVHAAIQTHTNMAPTATQRGPSL
jgi:hypothetical protein